MMELYKTEVAQVKEKMNAAIEYKHKTFLLKKKLKKKNNDLRYFKTQ